MTPAAATSPGCGAGVCGGCPGLTWKRVANLSGEVSPLVWLGGGTGDLGTRESGGVWDLPQQRKAPGHGTVPPFPRSPKELQREQLGPQLGPVGQVTAASAAWPR